MVTVPGGTYVRCQRCRASATDRVEISTGAFRIDQDEVTQAQYTECVAAKHCLPPLKLKYPDAEEPARGVSWIDADNYCKFVGKRLPTEAEWERAAYPPPTNIDSGPRIGRKPCLALIIGGYDGEICPGRPLPSPNHVSLRLIANGQAASDMYDHVDSDQWPDIYDLYGNVAEWVADWDAQPSNPEYYFQPKTRNNPRGPESGKRRIIRGGSFAAKTGSIEGERRRDQPTERLPDVGFRCAADL